MDSQEGHAPFPSLNIARISAVALARFTMSEGTTPHAQALNQVVTVARRVLMGLLACPLVLRTAAMYWCARM